MESLSESSLEDDDSSDDEWESEEPFRLRRRRNGLLTLRYTPMTSASDSAYQSKASPMVLPCSASGSGTLQILGWCPTFSPARASLVSESTSSMRPGV